MPEPFLLPLTTAPWRIPIERRHKPPEPVSSSPFGYRKFLSCLRWEFGFTCAFCLLHEADFQDHGAKGSGQMSIEHGELASAAPSRVNAYENCFYACRYCNQAREVKPLIDGQMRRLLNPCQHAWEEFFVLDGHEVRARADSPDAVYTIAAYRLNDARKRVRRRSGRRRSPRPWRSCPSFDRNTTGYWLWLWPRAIPSWSTWHVFSALI
jgi:hypothetical protein